jgi:hypothetical protein
METQVECYSGVEYAERPTAFAWQGQRLVVEEVLQRWRAPGYKCFRVRAGGQTFELRYDEHTEEWQIEII